MAAILGGGLGGLSTGYYLLKNNVNSNLRVFLLEATDYCGGWIKSIRTKDYIFEQGPRTIRPKGPAGLNTLNMIQDLGLSEHVSPIRPDHPAAKNRMICVNNNLHTLPSSLKGMFVKNKPFTKPLYYAFLKDLTRPQKEMKDDSIYNFVERRFGKEIADYAIAPMICGICAGDAKEISVKFLMKTPFEWEQNHGGVVKGMMRSIFQSKTDSELKLGTLATRALQEKWNVYTIKGGLETFPTIIHDYLVENDVKVNMNHKIRELEFVDAKNILLKSDKGSDIHAGHIFSSIPAFSLANLVEKQHPDLANELRDIPYVTVGIVNMYFANENHLINPAFGFLVPPKEKSPILGVVFDSCCMPDQKGTVLTVMMGGRWFKDRFGEEPKAKQLYDTALKQVKSILNINKDPTAHHVSILDKCIPQYVVGHYERVDKIRDYIKEKNLPISLVGSSFDGVGINDVILSAKKQVEKSLAQLKQ